MSVSPEIGVAIQNRGVSVSFQSPGSCSDADAAAIQDGQSNGTISCPYEDCSETISRSKTAIRRHISQEHFGYYTPFACKLCGMLTFDQTAVELHAKYEHANVPAARLTVFIGEPEKERMISEFCLHLLATDGTDSELSLSLNEPNTQINSAEAEPRCSSVRVTQSSSPTLSTTNKSLPIIPPPATHQSPSLSDSGQKDIGDDPINLKMDTSTLSDGPKTVSDIVAQNNPPSTKTAPIDMKCELNGFTTMKSPPLAAFHPFPPSPMSLMTSIASAMPAQLFGNLPLPPKPAFHSNNNLMHSNASTSIFPNNANQFQSLLPPQTNNVKMPNFVDQLGLLLMTANQNKQMQQNNMNVAKKTPAALPPVKKLGPMKKAIVKGQGAALNVKTELIDRQSTTPLQSNMLVPQGKLQCVDCSKVFVSAQTLHNHCARAKCKKPARYPTKATRQFHQTNKCDKCGKCFVQRVSLYRHIRDVHDATDLEAKHKLKVAAAKKYSGIVKMSKKEGKLLNESQGLSMVNVKQDLF